MFRVDRTYLFLPLRGIFFLRQGGIGLISPVSVRPPALKVQGRKPQTPKGKERAGHIYLLVGEGSHGL